MDPSELAAAPEDVEDVLSEDEQEYAAETIDAALRQAHAVMKRRVHPYVDAEEHDPEDVILTEALLAAELLTTSPGALGTSGVVSSISQESAEISFDTDADSLRESSYLSRAILVDPTGELGAPSVTMTVI